MSHDHQDPDAGSLEDAALDRELALLGIPAEGAPLAGAGEILARAAAITPVVVGLAGWKLAAALLATLLGGFGGGFAYHANVVDRPAPAASTGSALVLAPESFYVVERPAQPAAPGPDEAADTGTIDAPSGFAGFAPAAGSGGSGLGGGSLGGSVYADRLAPPGAGCPEPEAPVAAGSGADEDFEVGADPHPDGPAFDGEWDLDLPPFDFGGRDEASPEVDPEEETVPAPPVASNGRLRLETGPLSMPGERGLSFPQSGMFTQLGYNRDLLARQGWALYGGGALDLALLSAAGTGLRYAPGLQGELGVRLGNGWFRVEPGLVAGARFVLPGASLPDADAHADAEGREGDRQDGLHVVPSAGPRIGLSLGDPSRYTVRLSVGARAAALGGPDGGRSLAPWLDAAVGLEVPFGRRGS